MPINECVFQIIRLELSTFTFIYVDIIRHYLLYYLHSTGLFCNIQWWKSPFSALRRLGKKTVNFLTVI